MPGSPDTTTSPGAPATDRLPALEQGVALGHPAREVVPLGHPEGGGHRRRVLGRPTPAHRGHGDGFGETLQRPLAGGNELVVAPAPGQEADEVGHQDLVAAGLGAEPGGLHDRGAEAVVVLQCHVPGADPDADRQLVIGVALDVTAYGLLDGDGGPDGLGGAREQRQHTVAEALDDLAAVGR